jgi:hypothetical protein
MAVHPTVHQDGAAQAILPAAKVDDTLVTFKHQFSTFFCQDESCQPVLWKATASCFSLMRTGCVMAGLGRKGGTISSSQIDFDCKFSIQ